MEYDPEQLELLMKMVASSLGDKTTGISDAAEKYSGQSVGLDPGPAPGTGRVNNTGGDRGSIRNSNAPHLHSATRLRNILGVQ